MGLTREQVQQLIPGLKDEEDSPGYANATSVPQSHPDFESYGLQFSKKSGLCKIVAIGKDISTGSAGYELRSAFDEIDKALTAKYGKGKLYDFSSERYDSPEFWMMHLSQKNRTLAKVWSPEFGSTLSHNLGSVGLEAGASDMSTGYLVIRYEFSNLPDCVAESEAEKHKAL
jgi:hypothetical protein